MQLTRIGRTHRWRLALTSSVAVLVCAAMLGWYFPARWALPWLGPQLQGLRLQQVHGSLWHGGADRVLLSDGRVLGGVSWQVSRRVLFAATPMRLQFDGPRLAFSGDVTMLPQGRTQWERVELRADLALWQPSAMPGLGQPGGEWRMTVDHAVLQHGWPLQLELRARWHDATMPAHGARVALGDFEWQARAHAGIVDAQVHDVAGGPLQVAGRLLLGPLGWRLDARMRARQADFLLQRWLATLGSVDAAGTVRIQRHGGLAPLPAALPAPAASSAPVALAQPAAE